MLDTQSPKPMRQRVHAAASVSFAWRDQMTVLDRLAQQGSAKAMLPRCHRPDPEVVFLNTAGGLTGGDRMAVSVDLAAGTQAVATTQTAERAYASLSETGPAHMDVRLTLGAGARLDWLPQETILFDRAALHRKTEVDLEGDASLLWCEMLVLGREAMGETVTTLDFQDWRLIRRDGRPVLMEPMRLTTDSLMHRAAPSLLSNARAMATVVLASEEAERFQDKAQAKCAEFRAGEAVASAWDQKLIVRAIADQAWPLRQWLHSLLTEIRGAPLPRVWTL